MWQKKCWKKMAGVTRKRKKRLDAGAAYGCAGGGKVRKREKGRDEILKRAFVALLMGVCTSEYCSNL
jgi:hypothetical protein